MEGPVQNFNQRDISCNRIKLTRSNGVRDLPLRAPRVQRQIAINPINRPRFRRDVLRMLLSFAQGRKPRPGTYIKQRKLIAEGSPAFALMAVSSIRTVSNFQAHGL